MRRVTPTWRRCCTTLQAPMPLRDLKTTAREARFSRSPDRARDLIRDNAAVRVSCSGAHHFFVDEFQDTDPLQAEILLLLAADDPANSGAARPVPGKLFLVGDPKRSIYRFRRADVELYEDVKARLSSRRGGALHLTTASAPRPRSNLSSIWPSPPRWRLGPTAVRRAMLRLSHPPRDRRTADPRRPAGSAAI